MQEYSEKKGGGVHNLQGDLKKRESCPSHHGYSQKSKKQCKMLKMLQRKFHESRNNTDGPRIYAGF